MEEDALGAEKKFLTKFAEELPRLTAEEEDEPITFRVGVSTVSEDDFEGQVCDWALQYLYSHKCPYSLAAAVAHATLNEIKAGDVQGFWCKQQIEENNSKGKHAFDTSRLQRAVYMNVHKVCEQYQMGPGDGAMHHNPAASPLISVSAVKNGRRKMEDRHVVIPDINLLFGLDTVSPQGFYAVFDGHAGQEAAVYATAHLHHNIVRHPAYGSDIQLAIKEGFKETDERFGVKAKLENLKSGSTAVCAIVQETAIHVAWLGDSQALVARNGTGLNVVIPHKPEREDERERIESLGGCVVLFGTWRVNGTLAVSRAIGDAEFKPCVSAVPDVITIPREASDDFVILACDGLWDVMTAEDAAHIVYLHMSERPTDLEGASQKLIQIAVSRGSQDNITVIVVFLRGIPEILSSVCIPETPPPVSRVSLKEKLPEGFENGESPTKIIQDLFTLPENNSSTSPLVSPTRILNPCAPAFTPSISHNGITEAKDNSECLPTTLPRTNGVFGNIGASSNHAGAPTNYDRATPSNHVVFENEVAGQNNLPAFSQLLESSVDDSPRVLSPLWISDSTVTSTSMTSTVSSNNPFADDRGAALIDSTSTSGFQEYFLAQMSEAQTTFELKTSMHTEKVCEKPSSAAVQMLSFDSKPLASSPEDSGDTLLQSVSPVAELSSYRVGEVSSYTTPPSFEEKEEGNSLYATPAAQNQSNVQSSYFEPAEPKYSDIPEESTDEMMASDGKLQEDDSIKAQSPIQVPVCNLLADNDYGDFDHAPSSPFAEVRPTTPVQVVPSPGPEDLSNVLMSPIGISSPIMGVSSPTAPGFTDLMSSEPTFTTLEPANPFITSSPMRGILDSPQIDIFTSLMTEGHQVPISFEDLIQPLVNDQPVRDLLLEPTSMEPVFVESIPETVPVADDVVDDESEDGEGWQFYQPTNPSSAAAENADQVSPSVDSSTAVANVKREIPAVVSTVEVVSSTVITVTQDVAPIHAQVDSSIDSNFEETPAETTGSTSQTSEVYEVFTTSQIDHLELDVTPSAPTVAVETIVPRLEALVIEGPSKLAEAKLDAAKQKKGTEKTASKEPAKRSATAAADKRAPTRSITARDTTTRSNTLGKTTSKTTSSAATKTSVAATSTMKTTIKATTARRTTTSTTATLTKAETETKTLTASKSATTVRELNSTRTALSTAKKEMLETASPKRPTSASSATGRSARTTTLAPKRTTSATAPTAKKSTDVNADKTDSTKVNGVKKSTEVKSETLPTRKPATKPLARVPLSKTATAVSATAPAKVPSRTSTLPASKHTKETVNKQISSSSSVRQSVSLTSTSKGSPTSSARPTSANVAGKSTRTATTISAAATKESTTKKGVAASVSEHTVKQTTATMKKTSTAGTTARGATTARKTATKMTTTTTSAGKAIKPASPAAAPAPPASQPPSDAASAAAMPAMQITTSASIEKLTSANLLASEKGSLDEQTKEVSAPLLLPPATPPQMPSEHGDVPDVVFAANNNNNAVAVDATLGQGSGDADIIQ